MQSGSKLKLAGVRGVGYIWLLAALMTLSLGAAAIGPIWQTETQREREADLLRIGRLYAQAIAAYYKMSPGSQKRYPPSIDALLMDARFAGTVRHLRKAYDDPLNPGQPFKVLMDADGGVRGVYSASEAKPFKVRSVDLGIVLLPPAQRYVDWKFVPLLDR